MAVKLLAGHKRRLTSSLEVTIASSVLHFQYNGSLVDLLTVPSKSELSHFVRTTLVNIVGTGSICFL